jgi:hypothetical protein
MGEVVSADDLKIRLSISRLATEFGMARETVSKRLKAAGIKPDGKRDGYPVYRLRDAAPALIDAAPTDEDGDIDPDKLPPEKRRAWFQSERERMELESKAGKLVPALEHERDIARVLNVVVQMFETLPDVLERDESLAPHQVQRLQEILDAKRQELYEQLAGDEEDVRLSA